MGVERSASTVLSSMGFLLSSQFAFAFSLLLPILNLSLSFFPPRSVMASKERLVTMLSQLVLIGKRSHESSTLSQLIPDRDQTRKRSNRSSGRICYRLRLGATAASTSRRSSGWESPRRSISSKRFSSFDSAKPPRRRHRPPHAPQQASLSPSAQRQPRPSQTGRARV